jgi:DNA-binding response OmpR family regulator
MSNPTKILLVEDEENLARGLIFNLTEEGYTPIWAADGQKALELFAVDDFDLVILDIMLPYVDGFEVVDRIRQTDPQLPVLILTAKTHVDDRIRGLERGADDYLTKPFHLRELLLRVAALLKRREWYRMSSMQSPRITFGKTSVNFTNLTARVGKQTVHLTHHEAMLLRYLVDHEDRAVSRQDILRDVWQQNPDLETRTVDAFIARLRKIFEHHPSKPRHFISVRGVGYLFRR